LKSPDSESAYGTARRNSELRNQVSGHVSTAELSHGGTRVANGNGFGNLLAPPSRTQVAPGEKIKAVIQKKGISDHNRISGKK
jgi:hypothetical protein